MVVTGEKRLQISVDEYDRVDLRRRRQRAAQQYTEPLVVRRVDVTGGDPLGDKLCLIFRRLKVLLDSVNRGGHALMGVGAEECKGVFLGEPDTNAKNTAHRNQREQTDGGHQGNGNRKAAIPG